MGRQGKRRKVAKGIYVDVRGYEAMVMYAGVKRTRRFPLGTGIRVMEDWILDQKLDVKQAITAGAAPVVKTGTLAADAARYLAIHDVTSMTSYRDRRRHIEAWVAVLGTRKRSTITTDEIQRQLAAWADAGAAPSTVNHYRTALRHLYRVIDGKHARNPVAEAKKAVETSVDPKGRAINAMAMAHIIRHIRPRSLTRVRLALMVTTGITPVEILRLDRRAFVFGEEQSGSVVITARRKGKGAQPRTVPFMTVHAWRAALAFCRVYDREQAWGVAFSTSAMHKSFRLAVSKVRTRYREQGMDEARIDTLIRPDAKPYDARHTFGTFVARETKDDSVAQELLGHVNITTTQRYTRASVPDRIAAVVAKTHKRQRKAAEATTPATPTSTIVVRTYDANYPTTLQLPPLK